MQTLKDRWKTWWAERRYRQLQRRLGAIAERDVGYAQNNVPLNAPDREEQVFRFLNAQIAKSRRPYGFSLYMVSLSCVSPEDEQKPLREDFLKPFSWNDYWYGDVREQIRLRLHACNNAVDQVLQIAITSGGDLLKGLLDRA